jgi:HTH-type transcriptional regulator/antitoxin HigA
MTYPSPPGDTIRDILQERGISRFKFGCMIKLSEKAVLGLFDGSLPIDNDLAYRLSDTLGSTPTFWEERERLYREELRQVKE